MNRIEMIALFSALSKLCEKKDIDSVAEVINEVLAEARRHGVETENQAK